MAQIQFPTEFGVNFDAPQFDKTIRQHGVLFQHWRAQRCPVGMVDRYDDRHPDGDHSGCSRGFLMTSAGPIKGLFLSSGSKLNQQDLGLWDDSTVMCSLATTYEDSLEEVHVAEYDRLYVDDGIVVPYWQTAEAHITGRDRLEHPVVKVIDLVDARGKRYGSTDYTIVDGQISWNPGCGPGVNPELNVGIIFSVRYLYRPYWIIKRFIHQVRLVSIQGMEGQSMIRAPQQVVLQRENVSMNEANDDKSPIPNSTRQVRSPRSGSFGPR